MKDTERHNYIEDHIRKLREEKGWTQQVLGKKLGKKTSTISAYETNAFAVVQQPHLVRGHEVASRLLVVDAVTAAAAFALVVAGGGDGFLSQQFRDILVGFLFSAAEIEKLITQTDQRFPIVFIHGFELCHVLHDDRAENGAGTHGGQC